MKASLILFGVLLFKNFQSSLNTPMAYIEITDCGDGKYSSFVASITPYPLLYVGLSESTFWGAGQLTFTEEAKILASNVSAGDFITDLKAYYILDESIWTLIPDFLKPQVEDLNNTRVCGDIFRAAFCLTIQQGMISSLTNSTVFFPAQLGTIYYQLFNDIANFVLEIAQEIKVQLKIQFVLYGQTFLCARLGVKAALYNEINGTEKEYISKNIQNAFDTPKIINVNDQSETLSCPENSKEINNSSCECNYPFSGPLCSFHCQYDEMHWYACGIWPDEKLVTCTFLANDYIQYCIKDNNVQFLDGSITVDIVSLNHINIKWKVIHFTATYKYELTLQDNAADLGSITNSVLNLNGLETSYSLGSLCLHQTVFGVDCRNIISDRQDCFNCSDLSLAPFHNYTIVLKLGFDLYVDENDLAVYVMEAVNFTTPEVDVMAPKITGAALDDDQNIVSVDWMLTDKSCPGYIRRYQLTISCNSDQTTSSGNLTFDCRSGFQGPKLNGTVPGKCKSEDIYIKLRIGTANSTSDENEQFLLKNEAFSTWLIIASILGTFLIAVVIGLVIFYYYYKRHVESFQNAHQAVRKLMHFQRKSGVGQSFRARSAPDLPIPDIPESCNSPGGTTAYQTIAVTSEVGSPHSLQAPELLFETVPTTPRDSLGYTPAKFL